jgi:hypothetical protein
MQMVNIFEKYEKYETIRIYFNVKLLNYITQSLHSCLFYNLEDETFCWDLSIALKNNANE